MATAAIDASTPVRLQAHGLRAWFGRAAALDDVTLAFPDRAVTAVTGPSGCGKSTLLRCLNRMHETVDGARVAGRVTLDGYDLYARGVDVSAVRRHVGMVFQRPTPFPATSIRDTVAAGLAALPRGERPPRAEIDVAVERALRRAALWDEVKDRLREDAVTLSGGQQQRLCIARALASDPEVLLLDEPTASLDPANAIAIEELIYELSLEITVVLVTHNLQQAARISRLAALLLGGSLVEVAPTGDFFTRPRDPRTEAWVTGRFA